MKLPKSFIEKYPGNLKEVDTLLYVRAEKRKRVGVVIIHDGFCGWSLCDGKDKWSTEKGILKAIYRLKQNNSPEQVMRNADMIFSEGAKDVTQIKPRDLSFGYLIDTIDEHLNYIA